MRASLPLLLGLALAAAPAPAADDALKQALARLQSRYETTRTLTAEFRQSVESPTLASPLESRGTLTLLVRKADATVEEARITDPVGTTTRIVFANERRNVPLDAALFRFTPPPGVDVVRPPAY